MDIDSISLSDRRVSTDGDMHSLIRFGRRKTNTFMLDYGHSVLGDGNGRRYFRRMNDMFNTLPVHFTGRIRDVDNLIARLMVEVHGILTLCVNEINQNDSAVLIQIEESEQWDSLFSNMRREIIALRKKLRENIEKVFSNVEIQEQSRANIQAFTTVDAPAIQKATGIADFPQDIKRGLGDIVALLGAEGESRIDHLNADKPIKVV